MDNEIICNVLLIPKMKSKMHYILANLDTFHRDIIMTESITHSKKSTWSRNIALYIMHVIFNICRLPLCLMVTHIKGLSEEE